MWWVSNPRPPRLYYAARGHVCNLGIIHFVVCLNDRSMTSSKTSSLQSAIYCFLFQFLVPFLLRPSSSCLLLLPRVPITSFLYPSFNNVIPKAVPTQGVTNPVIRPAFCCVGYSCLLKEFWIESLLSHSIHCQDDMDSSLYWRRLTTSLPVFGSEDH